MYKHFSEQHKPSNINTFVFKCLFNLISCSLPPDLKLSLYHTHNQYEVKLNSFELSAHIIKMNIRKKNRQ